MRTSVTLDDEVYELASTYAHARDITLGAAIGELVRRGEKARSSESPLEGLERAPNGMLVFASRGRVITSEMVKACLEDEID
jgi:predicted DNA-binding ribbon-helix-helix protein